MASNHVASLEYGSCQGACRGRFATDQTSADSEHAADAIGKFAREVGHDLVEIAALEPKIGARVIVGERLGFAFLNGKREQISGILAPVDVPDRIDPLLGERNGAEILRRACLVTDGDGLAA